MVKLSQEFSELCGNPNVHLHTADQGSRGDGTTIRQVMEALTHFKKGDKVFFISNSTIARDYAFRIACDTMDARLVKHRMAMRRLEMVKGEGFIQFDTPVPELRGFGKVHVFLDHYLTE